MDLILRVIASPTKGDFRQEIEQAFGENLLSVGEGLKHLVAGTQVKNLEKYVTSIKCWIIAYPHSKGPVNHWQYHGYKLDSKGMCDTHAGTVVEGEIMLSVEESDDDVFNVNM